MLVKKEGDMNKKYFLGIITSILLLTACVEKEHPVDLSEISSEYAVFVGGKIPSQNMAYFRNLRYLQLATVVRYYVPMQYDGKSNFYLLIKAASPEEAEKSLREISTRMFGFTIDQKLFFKEITGVLPAADREFVSVILEKKNHRFHQLSWKARKDSILSEGAAAEEKSGLVSGSEGYLLPGNSYDVIRIYGFSAISEAFRFFADGFYDKNVYSEKNKIIFLKRISPEDTENPPVF